MKITNHKSQITNFKSGFTLIELLVVVAIIGVLSALLMTNFIGIRQRARDGQRKSDLRQIQSALELYRADQGSYPSSITLNNCTDAGSSLTSTDGNTVYMKKIPCDPLNSTTFVYQYSVTPLSGSYCLRACVENLSDAQKDTTNNGAVVGCTLSNCASGSVSYTLQNP